MRPLVVFMSCRIFAESEFEMGDVNDDALREFKPVSTPGGLPSRGRSLKELGEYVAGELMVLGCSSGVLIWEPEVWKDPKRRQGRVVLFGGISDRSSFVVVVRDRTRPFMALDASASSPTE